MANLEEKIIEMDWLVSTNWRESTQRFREAGLSDSLMINFAEEANAKPAAVKWKWFCGCCWRTLRPQPDVFLLRGLPDERWYSDEDMTAQYDWGMVQ